MPFVEYYNTGSVGVVRDTPAHELPPEAWTDCRNVRFIDAKAMQMPGYRTFDTSACATPTFAIAVPRQGTTADMWVYTSDTEVYAFNGSANYKITASAVSATGQNTWSGCLLSGILVLNYQQGKPLYWPFPPNTATTMSVLPDWSASWTCAVMRSFKNYLVAMNTTEGATSYPYRVRWSHAADAGAVPTSWDAADTTVDAGYNDLIEGGDFVVDAVPLVDRLMVYKENSTWAMTYIGGTFIWDFEKVYSNVGALSRHSVVPFGRRHFVVSQSEIYVHDGFSDPEPILQGRLKTFFYKNINRNHTDKVVCVPNYPFKEIWVLFPTESTGLINKCLVWNYETNVWSIKDVPAVKGGAHGAIEYADSGNSWNSQTGSWNDSYEIWNSDAAYRENRILLVGSSLYVQDSGWTADGTTYTSYLERKALPLGGQDRGGNPKPHHQSMKRVNAVWPRVTTRKAGTLSIYVGTQEDPMDAVTWYGPYRFDPTTMRKVDCRVTGRFIAIKFEGADDIGWNLDSFALDIHVQGRY